MTAVALAMVIGLSYTGYPVHAQEETEINPPATVEDVAEQEQDDSPDETETATEKNEITENENLTENEELSANANAVTAGTKALGKITTYAENNAGSFHVTGGTAETDWTYDSDENTLTFNNSGTYTITGDGQVTDERIIFESGTYAYDITIENLSITNTTESPIVIKQNADVNLTLNGENVLVATANERAALSVPQNASLVITEQSTGSLEATSGGQWSSGIGGDRNNGSGSGQITINGGTITATAGNEGAGIGGNHSVGLVEVEINGGTVTTTDNSYGIGGYECAGGNVTINGGTIITSCIGGLLQKLFLLMLEIFQQIELKQITLRSIVERSK